MLQRVVCWPITTWNHFWFEDVSPYGMAVYRMGLGSFLLAYFLSFFPHIPLLFSKEGIYVPVLAPDIAPSPGIAWLIYGASLVAIVLFTLGYRTALLTPLVLVFYLEHWYLNLAIKNTAYDRLLILLLVITCFAKLDKVWALSGKQDQWVSRAASHVLIPAWPGRLLGLQIAMLYFGSGVWKLLSPSWHTGQMLELTLLGPWGTRAGFWLASIGWSPWVYEAATWGVLGFELTVGFALYSRKLQKLAMCLGALFHLSIWFCLGIPEFMVCVAVYVLFLDPEQVRAAGDRLWRALGL